MPLSPGDKLGLYEIPAPTNAVGMDKADCASDPAPGRPSLSLILCSRNDNYAGNSVWRLQTAVNYLARHVEELKLESVVEVIVTEWGSHTPLRQRHAELQFQLSNARLRHPEERQRVVGVLVARE
jgi:hypothetical protein